MGEMMRQFGLGTEGGLSKNFVCMHCSCLACGCALMCRSISVLCLCVSLCQVQSTSYKHCCSTLSVSKADKANRPLVVVVTRWTQANSTDTHTHGEMSYVSDTVCAWWPVWFASCHR